MQKRPPVIGTTVSFRLPDETINRIEKRKRELESRVPGMVITQSDIVRRAIDRGLEAEESDK